MGRIFINRTIFGVHDHFAPVLLKNVQAASKLTTRKLTNLYGERPQSSAEAHDELIPPTLAAGVRMASSRRAAKLLDPNSPSSQEPLRTPANLRDISRARRRKTALSRSEFLRNARLLAPARASYCITFQYNPYELDLQYNTILRTRAN